MGFDIREFIITNQISVEKETQSQITIRCPICESKIQVSKAKGAYFCVGGCSTENIRKAWNAYSSSNYTPPSRLSVEPLGVDLRVNRLTRITNFSSSKVEETYFGRIIFYSYDENKRIKRIENKNQKKIFYPEVKVDDKWISVKNQEKIKIQDFPFYGEKYLKKKENKILVVEGEKCVDVILEKWGVIALSPPGGCWTENWIESRLAKLFWQIDSIIFIPDNDEIGRKKEKLFLKSAWYQGIPCTSFSIENYCLFQGEDIADLLLEDVNHPIKSQLLME